MLVVEHLPKVEVLCDYVSLKALAFVHAELYVEVADATLHMALEAGLSKSVVVEKTR